MTMKLGFSDPKKEFLNALYPLRRIAWINQFIKNAEQKHINVPTGENAPTERFIISLSLCFCLFAKNESSLMKHGELLKKYVNDYAAQVPETEAPLVKAKLAELISKISK